MTTKYRIINTDNFGGDYPNEKFVGTMFDSKEAAIKEADRLNGTYGGSNRFYKIVLDGYILQPGFEP